MPDIIKKRIAVTLLFILLAISLFLLPILSNEQDAPPSSSAESGTENNTLTLKLYDNTLCLFENREIVKKYEVNPSVLPGEDLGILSRGITVKSIAEADSIAEDYDG